MACLRARLILATLLCLPQLFVAQPLDPNHSVTLTPAVVVAGSPVLIHVNAPRDAELEGKWMGRKLEFFAAKSGHGWYSLAGVDVEAAVGASTLSIAEHDHGGSVRDLSRTVEILAAHYRTGTLTVAPKFVEPPPEELNRIKAESELKQKVFAASAGEPLWTANFSLPVPSQATDSFGTRRMFNGKLASIHKGMDFRAKTGTPVRAGNSGVVVLAQPLFYEGNCVIIDHGLGLFTLSMHLSRIDVKVGQRVAKGALLGLSGATGRVTGPHLHWSVRWEGANLDPAKLLKLDLGSAH